MDAVLPSRFSRAKNSLSFPFKRLSRRLVQTSLRGSRLEGKGKGVSLKFVFSLGEEVC